MKFNYSKEPRNKRLVNKYLLSCTFSINSDHGYIDNIVDYIFSDENKINELTENILIISELLQARGWSKNQFFNDLKQDLENLPGMTFMHDYFDLYNTADLNYSEITAWRGDFYFTYYDQNCVEYLLKIDPEQKKACRQKIKENLIKPFLEKIKSMPADEYYSLFKNLYNSYLLADKIDQEVSQSNKKTELKI